MDIGDELARKGKWVTLIVQETGQGKRVRLYLKYRPLALTLIALAVVGYLGSAVALSLWLDRRPHNLVKFQDIALPWRWTHLNELRGEGFALLGMAEIDAKNTRRGIFFIQRSLGLKPDNESARIAVSRLYGEQNYYEGVRRVLEPQLDIRFSREVAELLFEQALRADDYPFVVEMAGALRAEMEPSSRDAQWLLDQQVLTLLSNLKTEEALEILRGTDARAPENKNRWVRVLTAAGKYEEALALAESIAPALPGIEKIGLKLQAVVRSAQGDEAALLELLDRILEDRSTSTTPWMFGIEVLGKAEMNDVARTWIGDYLTRFAARPGAVNQLLMQLASVENPTLQRYATQRAQEWQQLSMNHRFVLALTLIRAGEWDALAEDFSDIIEADQSENMLSWWLGSVLEALNPDSSAESLSAFLGESAPPIIVYLVMAQGFASEERWDLVKSVIDAGMRYHSFSVSLRHWDERATEQLADVVVEESNASKAADDLRFRYTAEDVPALRLKLRRWAESENWDDLESEILKIRLQQPVWMNEIEPTLDWVEVHAAAARGDFERLRMVAPRVLRREGEMAGWFTDQAELAIEGGATDSAIRLLEVILAEEKFYHRARAILKELTLVDESPEPQG